MDCPDRTSLRRRWSSRSAGLIPLSGIALSTRTRQSSSLEIDAPKSHVNQRITKWSSGFQAMSNYFVQYANKCISVYVIVGYGVRNIVPYPS
jgi:hypothetical protein